MGFIYKITNQINQKSYIGLTTSTIEERWKEHLQVINKCVSCGKVISKSATYCKACYHNSTKGKFKISLSDMPVTREELKQLIRTTPFVQIGKQFNVTDNAIRKWCDKFGLPKKVSEIKKISDEEWDKI